MPQFLLWAWFGRLPARQHLRPKLQAVVSWNRPAAILRAKLTAKPGLESGRLSVAPKTLVIASRAIKQVVRAIVRRVRTAGPAIIVEVLDRRETKPGRDKSGCSTTPRAREVHCDHCSCFAMAPSDDCGIPLRTLCKYDCEGSAVSLYSRGDT